MERENKKDGGRYRKNKQKKQEIRYEKDNEMKT